ncbi:MAG TPA: ATP-binding protein [Steroidobacteraceae bacterium]|jgi:two-component system OmpR family sensor kinase|nr:ATP-binding protein [Steroidobacteraceae bacterium]
MSSLHARLLAWLLGGVLVVGAAGGFIVYRNALHEADGFYDYQLEQTALILRDEPVDYAEGPRLPPQEAGYDFVVQVWSLDGVRVYLSRPHAVLPQVTKLGFDDVDTREGRWRVFGVQAATRFIQVAQPMRVRQEGAVQLALDTLKPFALLLPGLALLIWFAVGHALQPLERLTAQVGARRVDALEPLAQGPLPREVQPLVAALNELLGRLRAALERERAFMADAAHELRTPLTALHLQMGMLAKATDESERRAAMDTLAAGVQRAIHLIEQMLALARQEPRADPVRVPVRLDDLARDTVAELVALADAGGIDLGVSSAAPAEVAGDPEALRTLLRNLVDNAVRYGGPGGRVDVAVEPAAEGSGARIAVSDDGPGIAPEERTRVFDRFYRRAGTRAPGSGLGLAIVKAIADAHGATVTLGDGLGGRGLTARVTFPPESGSA